MIDNICPSSKIKAMKTIITLSGLLFLSSCAELSKLAGENKQPKISKTSTSKKIAEAKKSSNKPDISGTLNNGTIYEATPDQDGFVISFDPFIAENDAIFVSVTNQIIAKLYSDKINDESHISIESDIDYTIFKGSKARYRIVPFKESSGEISSFSITSII